MRIRVAEVSVIGRNTQGVRLIHLGAGEHLVGIESVRGVIEIPESDSQGAEISSPPEEPK